MATSYASSTLSRLLCRRPSWHQHFQHRYRLTLLLTPMAFLLSKTTIEAGYHEDDTITLRQQPELIRKLHHKANGLPYAAFVDDGTVRQRSSQTWAIALSRPRFRPGCGASVAGCSICICRIVELNATRPAQSEPASRVQARTLLVASHNVADLVSDDAGLQRHHTEVDDAYPVGETRTPARGARTHDGDDPAEPPNRCVLHFSSIDESSKHEVHYDVDDIPVGTHA